MILGRAKEYPPQSDDGHEDGEDLLADLTSALDAATARAEDVVGTEPEVVGAGI